MVICHVAIVSQCQFYMNGKLHHMSNIGSSKHVKWQSLIYASLLKSVHFMFSLLNNFVSHVYVCFLKKKKKRIRTRNPQLIIFLCIYILCTYNLNFCQWILQEVENLELWRPIYIYIYIYIYHILGLSPIVSILHVSN